MSGYRFKPLRAVALAFAVIILLLACFLSVNAEQRVEINGYVYDKAGVFSETELARINRAAEQFYTDNGCSVWIVTAESRFYDGDDFCDELGLSGDIIVLVIADNSFRNYDLYTYGKAYSAISDSEVNTVLDADGVYDNIKAGRYCDGAIAFIEETSKVYKPDWVLAFILAVIFGLIGAGVACGCVVGSYKKKLRSAIYPLERYTKMELVHSNDYFKGKFVTSRRISSGSSGGRGGRSGGGGGGHRGGR